MARSFVTFANSATFDCTADYLCVRNATMRSAMNPFFFPSFFVKILALGRLSRITREKCEWMIIVRAENCHATGVALISETVMCIFLGSYRFLIKFNWHGEHVQVEFRPLPSRCRY